MDYYRNQWSEEIENNGKCFNYRMFKRELEFEDYLVRLPAQLRTSLTKFRVCNHKLPIELSRFDSTPRSQRLCNVCNKLGDEFHFLFECVQFRNERKLLLSKKYQENVNADDYSSLFSTSNYKKMCKLAKFVRIIVHHFR